jgi:gliding motility-associated-like protein
MLDTVSFATTLPLAPTTVTTSSTANPVNVTMHKEGSDYYGFATNYNSNEVLKLAFGSSPLSAPTVTNLGTFGMTSGQTEGIEIVKDGGNYYGFVVSGYNLLRLSFGNTLANTPTGTLMPFNSVLSWPHQLVIKKVGNNYIGFVANRNGYITRFEWGTNIAGTPTATNLPNIGGVANPCNLVLHQEGGNWYMLITSLISAAVSRYDFGPSLLNNAPTGTPLGNFGVLNLCRSIGLVKDCNELVGYVLNQSGTLYRMQFGNSITNTPTLTPAGTIGSGLVNAFHPFVYNDRIYLLIAASSQNKIERCELHALPTPTLTKWYDSTYTHTFATPGVYNITLHVDQGFFSGASAFCKSIVVLPGSAVLVSIKDSAIDCRRMLLTASGNFTGPVQWSFGDGTSGTGNPTTHTYPGGGPYTVTATVGNTGGGPCGGGGGQATRVVTPINSIPVFADGDTSVCSGIAVRLAAKGGFSYRWTPVTGLSNATDSTPTARPTTSTTYYVTGTNAEGCEGTDSVRVEINGGLTVVATSDAQSISCDRTSVQMHASGASTYVWQPGQYLDDSTSASPVASPPGAITFTVTGYNADGCTGSDSYTLRNDRNGSIFMPDAFSPNGDLRNDKIRPLIICDYEFRSFQIYDRWGKRMFVTYNEDEGWDGTFDGQPCEMGVYYYYIYGYGAVHGGGEQMFKGDITLVR